MQKIHIIPAVLPGTYHELQEKLGLVARVVTEAQIDVCDGRMTAEATWPYQGGGRNRERLAELFLNEEEGLPHWQELSFEIDLIALDPDKEVEMWIMAGASRIVLHLESASDEVIRSTATALKERGVDPVLAINPETDDAKLRAMLRDGVADAVQCMGIKKIGYQGQPFATETVTRVASLRQEFPEISISVDGGVTMETAPLLADAGADRLVVGSAIFRGLPRETIGAFQELLNG